MPQACNVMLWCCFAVGGEVRQAWKAQGNTPPGATGVQRGQVPLHVTEGRHAALC